METRPAAAPPPDLARSSRRRRRLLRRALAALAVIAVAAGVGVVGIARFGWLDPGPAQGNTPPAGAAALTDAERAYYEYVAPRLHQLAAETTELARLGAQKSRNLLAIEGHGRRVTTLVGEINAYAAGHGVPPRFAPMATEYRQGAGLATAAMRETQSAFLTFDWNRVARAVDAFNRGAHLIDAAAADLDRAGGVAPGSPVGADP